MSDVLASRRPMLLKATSLVPQTLRPGALRLRPCATVANERLLSGRGAGPSGRKGDGNNGAPRLAEETGGNTFARELTELKAVVGLQNQRLQQQESLIQQLQSGAEAIKQQRQAATLVPQRGQGWNGWRPDGVSPFEAQRTAMNDRRQLGMYDSRFHSTNPGATPKDFRILPRRIILVRHAESEGNIDNFAYTYVPDPQVPLTTRGIKQAQAAGQHIREMFERDGGPYKLHFYMSPYKRSQQTMEQIVPAFSKEQIAGCQEEVQLREQDFGNFQDAAGKQTEKAERLRFGRFFYRFPNGESGADVYDRMTIFEDHMIRDINAGRYGNNTSLVLVTHGLALRIFLMRWFHWSVDQFLNVYNPPNAAPLVLERKPEGDEGRPGGPASWMHTKALYRLTPESRDIIKGCSAEMCTTSSLPKYQLAALLATDPPTPNDLI